MAERLAELRARLEQLLAAVTKETDPAKYDALCAEIWRVLDEQERVLGQQSSWAQSVTVEIRRL